MNAAAASVIRRGREKARSAPWRGDRDTALLTPVPETPLLSVDFVRHCLETLSREGFHRVVTAALSPLEQAGFLAAGFGVEEDLRLLSMTLGPGLEAVPGGMRLIRARRKDRGAALEVDAAAFVDFWRFDALSLEDALRATRDVRFRLARPRGGAAAGYAIVGQAGRRGYVQRLAVHPDAQHRGVGRRLLLDGLHWLAQRGADTAYVNTQIHNEPALALYRSVGFRDEPVGLSVLSAGLS